MSRIKRFAIVALAAIVGVTGLELGTAAFMPGTSGYVSEAQAIIGRPLTPVSVAGVARRTVRRCAVGVYYC
jgi:hypothetical protein